MRRRSAAPIGSRSPKSALEPEGDARFPPIDPGVWREVRREQGARGPKDEADFTFVEYERVGENASAARAKRR